MDHELSHQCPVCHYANDTAASIIHPEATPRPGDVSICIRCASVNLFTEQLQLKIPDPMEQLALELDEGWKHIEQTVTLIKLSQPLKSK